MRLQWDFVMTTIEFVLGLFVHLSRSIFLCAKYPNNNDIFSPAGIKDVLRFNYGPSAGFYV